MQNSAVWTVAISADGYEVAIGLESGALKVLGSRTGETLFEDTDANTKPVMSLEFSPDRKHLVTGSWDKTIRLWNTEKRAAIGTPVTEHKKAVRSFAFTRNGQQLVSGGSDGTIRLWDVVPAQSDCNYSNGPVLSERAVISTDVVNAISFTSDETRIISGSHGVCYRVLSGRTSATKQALCKHRW